MTEKPVVLMTHDLPEEWVGDKLNNWQVIYGNNQQRGIDAGLQEHLPEAAGILCLLDDPIPAEILIAAPNLKVVSNLAVGTDNIDLNSCTRLGIPVGNTPDVLTDGTADLTVALLLAFCRQIYSASQDARQGKWSNWEPTGWLGADLRNATVGIVGLGKIGTAVAERLSPFGCKLIFTNRSPLPDKEETLNARQVSLDELLQTSDFICLHVPLNKETKKMIDQTAFEKMKPTAILINAARGAVVETDALIHALRSGKIRAAGLDVTDPEPLPPEHPLYQLPNCLITPHIGSATVNTRKVMVEIALNNLEAGIEGTRLPFCVNPEVYSQGGKVS
ncbi:MAG: D-glycerate dehydrogenase [Chloroflexi bacterium]|nr:D-glycerate dehydrogenase [Chloroflexota bacterium]